MSYELIVTSNTIRPNDTKPAAPNFTDIIAGPISELGSRTSDSIEQLKVAAQGMAHTYLNWVQGSKVISATTERYVEKTGATIVTVYTIMKN